MTALLDTVDAMLEAILSGGRGADGSLGPWAQADSIPAALFRRCNEPLEHVLEPSVFDRAWHLEWTEDGTPSPAESVYSPRCFESFRATLTLGVLYGAQQLDGTLVLVGAETAAVALQLATRRLAGDNARVTQALRRPELYEDNAAEPRIVKIDVAPGTTVDQGGGRLTRVVPLTVLLDRLNAPYAP